MKKQIEIECCDLCGKEAKTVTMYVPTYRTFDSEEGRIAYSEKRFYNEKLDLCAKCMEKVAVVHSIGIQCEKYSLED